MLQIHFLLESTAVHYGGTGLAAQQLAQALVEQDTVVNVHLLRDEAVIWPRTALPQLIWSTVPQGAMSRLRYLWQIGCADRSNTVVHLHGIWNPWWAIAAQLLTWRQVPFAVSPHGSLEPHALLVKRWKKRLALALYQRRALKQARAIVVTSGKEADGVAALGLGVPIRLVPNGVKLPSNQTDLDDSLQFDAQHKSQTRAFIFVSRIHPIKGLPMLVRAWARVRQPGWRVVVAGHDEQGHLAEIQSLAAKLGVSDDFDFPGSVQGSAKERLFAQADVFVLPTLSENFGIVVAEALGYGVPVITTHGAPWSGLLENGCGWWCEIDDIALANAMAQAMSLPRNTLQAMGQAGRTWVEHDFNWDTIAQQAIKTLYVPMLKPASRCQMGSPSSSSQ